MTRLVLNHKTVKMPVPITIGLTVFATMAGLMVSTQIAHSTSFYWPDEKPTLRDVNHDSVVGDLKPQEQGEVYRTVGEDWEKGFSDEGMSLQQGRAIVLRMDIEEIAASKRETNLLVSSNDRHFCSPTGNCPVWVFKRDHAHLRLVLAGLASAVEVQTHMTKEVHDLALRTQWGENQSRYTIYRWTGSAYKAVECFVNNPNGNEGNCPF